MTRAVFDALLAEARATHAGHPDVGSFCPFPDDLRPNPVTPFAVPASGKMQRDSRLTTDRYSAFRDALIAAAPFVTWRETYRDTDIDPDFLQRFGCYEVIGVEGPFASATMRSFVIYADAGLHYPWHHHPAEELYLVLAGEAEFHVEGSRPRRLGPGATVLHPSNAPHALTTHDHPVMAYVVWRSDFGTAPVWTSQGGAP